MDLRVIFIMKIIIGFLAALILFGCSVKPIPVEITTPMEKEPKVAHIDYEIRVASNYGYNYCADKNFYYYAEFPYETKCGNSIDFLDNFMFGTSYKNVKSTRLHSELNERVKLLSEEFICIKLSEGPSSIERIIYSDQLARKKFPEKKCENIYTNHLFVKSIEKNREKCKQIGFKEETVEMSNCILQFIDNEKTPSTTVVVQGGSSNDGIVDELKSMNSRQNQIYYENMYKRGMDILNCTTWPYC